MIGAIAGDIIGSIHEFRGTKTRDFELFTPASTFTDDTVLTVAVADCILSRKDYATTFKDYGRRYPNAGYGGKFWEWIRSDRMTPYNSFGNGSAMRVSPLGFAFPNMDTVMLEAEKCAAITHNHPEGIKGAQAVASCIFLARAQQSKVAIRKYLEDRFHYDLHRRLDDIRPSYRFDETCQGSVPEAIIAFLESTDYEGAVRNAVSLGGDADTLACMAGGMAQAYYGHTPEHITAKVRNLLPLDFLRIVDQFNEQFGMAQ